jgi:RIP metalloprotease RseP
VDGQTRGYRIGFGSDPMQVEKLPLSEAFTRSVDDCEKLSGLVFDLIGRMAERRVSVKQMSGPIEIVRISGEVVHHGDLVEMLQFMAMMSLQLGLFNLLPVPILDGGLIAMLLIESAMRRDINEGLKIRLYPGAVCRHGDLQRRGEDAAGPVGFLIYKHWGACGRLFAFVAGRAARLLEFMQRDLWRS